LEFGLGISVGLRRANDLIVDAHRRDGKRFIVGAEEILTAFLEAERAIHQFAVSLLS
jgi:hypothetical protein